MKPGTEIPVWVYSNCDEVELFLNGQSLGKDQPSDEWQSMQCEWLVPWEPGTIKAIGYRSGKPVTETIFKTAGVPEQLHLVNNDDALKADGVDMASVVVKIHDKEGTMYPYGENRVFFHLDGPAVIKALGNGDPVDHDKFQGVNNRRAYFGLCRAFVEATHEKGAIQLIAASILGERRQITSDKVSIDVKALALRGNPKTPGIEIYYTTDGTKPSRKSKRYSRPFKLQLGSVVKALVVANGKDILGIEESFAGDAGISWASLSERKQATLRYIGDQAENAKLTNAQYARKGGANYKGDGYVIFKSPKGSVDWFYENDGGDAEMTVHFRYSANSDVPLDLVLNDKVVEEALVFEKTGTMNRDWSNKTVIINLARGANHIVLQAGKNFKEVSIDELRMD